MDLSNMYKKEINRQSDEIVLKNSIIITMAIMIIALMIMVYGFMSRAIELNEENKELRIEIEQLVDENNMIQAKYSQSQRILNDARVKLLTSYKNATQAILQEIRDTYYIEGIPLTQMEQQYIHRVTDRYDIDYEIFMSIMMTESEFEQYAKNINTSGSQDIGYMQVSSPNHDDINNEIGRELDYYKFEDNILGAVTVLNWFRDDNIPKWISMYNMGYLVDEFYADNGHYYTPYYNKVIKNKEVLFDE